jgi:hypothetical protein
MADRNDTQIEEQTFLPSPVLKKLDRLVGTWNISGGAVGTLTYEWMEGGFFLIQHVDLEHYGYEVKGLEVIGHLKPFGEEPSEDVKSRFFGNMGDTLDYAYEVDGNTLTIWGGVRSSPAYYRGEFSPDGNILTGRWVYPGGGGYDSTATRIVGNISSLPVLRQA